MGSFHSKREYNILMPRSWEKGEEEGAGGYGGREIRTKGVFVTNFNFLILISLFSATGWCKSWIFQTY